MKTEETIKEIPELSKLTLITRKILTETFITIMNIP